MTENEENLRDLVTMFAITGLLTRGEQLCDVVPMGLDIADEFMAKRRPDGGIAAIKKRKKDVPES